MYRHTLIALAVTVTATGAFAASNHDTHWGYTGHGAPEQWGSLAAEFGTCSAGKSQSPVDIVATVDGQLPALSPNYRPSEVTVVNNGHTIQVDYADSANTLSVGGKEYTLKQFHFHVPSENKIKGKQFPMEAHFVHADAEGNLAVVGVLYENGRENAKLAPIWKVMPKKEGSVKLRQTFNAADLLPGNLDYYRFSGSLTTPPCSEGVAWMVLKNYDHISAKQAARFQAVIGSHNNRPVQPLNARIVVE